MKITIRDKEYELKELKYLDTMEISDIKQSKGIRPAMKKMFELSGIPGELVEDLTREEGLKVNQKIDELNKELDFPNPTEEKEN